MKSEFIPYEQAVEIKELGFDKSCFAYYAGAFFGDLMIKEIPHCVISAPSFSQAFRWFRENYWLIGEIFSQLRPSNNFMYGFKIGGSDIIFDGFHTYEEAQLACLKKLIEIVKSK
jgi:hypothetical protein